MLKDYFKKQQHSYANYFQFENWKYSIDLLAIVFQTQISAALAGSTTIASKFTTLALLTQQYNSSTDSQIKSQLNIQLKSLTNDITNSINDAYDAYDQFVSNTLFLTSYFISNIMQIIFAKVRRKVVELFTVEQITNAILLFVVLNEYFLWKFDY